MRVLAILILFAFVGRSLSAQPFHSGMAPVNGTRLYYEIAGQGEALVLIHGLALDTRMWDAQWTAFAKHYKVIRYDVRGFGQSDRAHDPHNPTEDLLALLDYLKISKAHLAGLSMGGNIALNFAAKYPERVLKVVAADANIDGFTDYTRELNSMFDKIIGLASRQGWHDEEQAIWLRMPLMRLYAADDKALINLSEITADYNGDHFINPRINPYFGLPTTQELLPNIKALTLVIVGEKDEKSILHIGQMLREKIPNAQQEIIKGAGHLSNMDKPKVFNKAVLQFLK
ncbi:MAG: alpha/beta hydrolase [Spirosomataceae bacterium]